MPRFSLRSTRRPLPPAEGRPARPAAVGGNAMRRRRTWRRVGTVVLTCAVMAMSVGATVLAMAPAAWMADAFARVSQGRVMLADAEGSVWQGSARLMLNPGGDPGVGMASSATWSSNGNGPGSGATLMPYRVNWHTLFWPLFIGRLRLVLQEDRPLSQPIVIDARAAEVTVFAGAIEVPASVLVGLGAPFNTLNLEGEIRLEWTDWRILGQRAFGRLTVNLRDVGSSISRLSPLGSYRAVFDAEGAGGQLRLTTVSGPLSLTGSGELQGGHIRFNGQARSTPEALPNLAGLLNLMGPPIDDRTHALIFQR